VGLESKAGGSESRFIGYVEAITSSALGHADRMSPFRSYCAGLLLPGDRKSVEPMAARVQPGRVQVAHQSLHHFVAKSDWSDDAVLAAVRARVLPVIERRGRIRALIIDDTGIPKKGKHSVGVARRHLVLNQLVAAWRGTAATEAMERSWSPDVFDPPRQPASADLGQATGAGPSRQAWRRVTWREGTNTKLVSRFAAVRVRPAHRDYHRSTPRPEEWCLIEWPSDEPEPTKYFLSTLPASISRRELVNTAKLRWRIERDYQDLKQELGLGHYEGRGWRGFHHHATLCIAAYGFLISERGAIPPSGTSHAPIIKEPRLPDGYRPR
jgi:SRSO17 transposase